MGLAIEANDIFVLMIAVEKVACEAVDAAQERLDVGSPNKVVVVSVQNINSRFTQLGHFVGSCGIH